MSDRSKRRARPREPSLRARVLSVREQRVARPCDALELFATATDIGMGGLGESTEGGLDLGGLERALEGQPENGAVLSVVTGFSLERQGRSVRMHAAALMGVASEVGLSFAPRVKREDQASAERESPTRPQLVEVERPNEIKRRLQEGFWAACAVLHVAERYLDDHPEASVPNDEVLLTGGALRSHAGIANSCTCGAKTMPKRRKQCEVVSVATALQRPRLGPGWHCFRAGDRGRGRLGEAGAHRQQR